MLFYTFLVSFLLFANALEFNLDAETIERQRTNEVCDEASVDNHRRLTNTCHLGVCKKVCDSGCAAPTADEQCTQTFNERGLCCGNPCCQTCTDAPAYRLVKVHDLCAFPDASLEAQTNGAAETTPENQQGENQAEQEGEKKGEKAKKEKAKKEKTPRDKKKEKKEKVEKTKQPKAEKKEKPRKEEVKEKVKKEKKPKDEKKQEQPKQQEQQQEQQQQQQQQQQPEL